MKNYILPSFFLLVFACAIVVYSFDIITVDRGTKKAEKIDSVLTKNYNEGKFNGVALISINGKVFHKKGFGYANLEHKIHNI